MSYRASFVATLILAGLLSATPRCAQGQDSACTYDDCALRFEARFFGPRVVAGLGGTRVSRPAFGGFRIPVLATAGDSARLHYASYRKDGPRAAVFGLVGLVGTAAGVLVLQRGNYERNTEAGVALVAAGLGLSIAADVNRQRASNHLHLSIWHYNRGLRR